MFLIDTNVLSDAYKGVQQPSRWLAHTDPDKAFVSVITIGEIERGVVLKQRKDAIAARKIGFWLQGLRQGYGDRLLPVSEEIATLWGRLSAARTRGTPDGLIAATALVHDLILVTRNVADFEDTGLTVLNPWTL